MLQLYQRGSWVRFPVRTDFSRRFGCITPLHPAGRPRCPDMGGKKVLETSTVNERGGIVAYGVQPSRIRRIYTDNSVYIIRCAVWRVSKIGRGLFSPVVKTPGCYNGIRGGPGFNLQYARISPAGSYVSLLCIPPGGSGAQIWRAKRCSRRAQ
jgi:hypothetical protein